MASDWQQIGDRQGLGERVIGRIVDQARQAPLENMKTEALFLRFAKSGLVRDRQIGRDMGELPLVAIITRDERDLHAQMLAHGIKDPIDSLAPDPPVRQGGFRVRLPERGNDRR